jgi:alpha-glucosidase (family GH31 glycosyl hydrolase)
MIKVFHKAGMKVVPNVKPCKWSGTTKRTRPISDSVIDMLHTHPLYETLRAGDGFFYDPISKGPSKQNLWSSGMAESGDGSWIDFSSPEARRVWAEGIRGLVEYGVDGIWE